MSHNIEKINNSLDAIKCLVDILNELQKNLNHHEFDCVIAYLKEKYMI